MPQFWQKVAPAATTVLHLGQFLMGTLVGCVWPAVMFWPQLAQNFEVEGMCAWQLGQMMSATDMPALLGVVWNSGGMRTMPAPRAPAPPP